MSFVISFCPARRTKQGKGEKKKRNTYQFQFLSDLHKLIWFDYSLFHHMKKWLHSHCRGSWQGFKKMKVKWLFWEWLSCSKAHVMHSWLLPGGCSHALNIDGWSVFAAKERRWFPPVPEELPFPHAGPQRLSAPWLVHHLLPSLSMWSCSLTHSYSTAPSS